MNDIEKHRLLDRDAALVGGNANNGTNAGLANVNLNNAASNTNTNIGSQLGFSLNYHGPYLLVKNFITYVGIGSESEDSRQTKHMKRIGNLYDKIISIENLVEADRNARKGKKNKIGVIIHDRNKEENIKKLHEILKAGTFKTSKYNIFKIQDPKEREIFCLPYYPDRIVHWAIMLQLESIWTSIFTTDTYACIKDRGMHGAAKKLDHVMKTDHENTKYCLKIDIKKYFPSINQDTAIKLIEKKIKCKKTISLLNEILHSTEKGLPIGNYISQYVSNVYLAYFDHWVKETLKVKYYFRYCDDMVFLSNTKENLWVIFGKISEYLKDNLSLVIKDNYQVFPTNKRGIDFVGYVFHPEKTALRKSIKKNMMRKHLTLARIDKKGIEYKKQIAPYIGWVSQPFSDTKNLYRILMTRFSDLNIKCEIGTFEGKKVSIDSILNVEILIIDYKIEKSKYAENNPNRLQLAFERNGDKYITFSGSKVLMDLISKIPKDKFPIETTIIKHDKRYIFT